jgi:hypothetical protein
MPLAQAPERRFFSQRLTGTPKGADQVANLSLRRGRASDGRTIGALQCLSAASTAPLFGSIERIAGAFRAFSAPLPRPRFGSTKPSATPLDADQRVRWARSADLAPASPHLRWASEGAERVANLTRGRSDAREQPAGATESFRTLSAPLARFDRAAKPASKPNPRYGPCSVHPCAPLREGSNRLFKPNLRGAQIAVGCARPGFCLGHNPIRDQRWGRPDRPHRFCTAAPYGVAVVANASVRFAVLPLLAWTKNGTNVLPKWSSPS